MKTLIQKRELGQKMIEFNAHSLTLHSLTLNWHVPVPNILDWAVGLDSITYAQFCYNACMEFPTTLQEQVHDEKPSQPQ